MTAVPPSTRRRKLLWSLAILGAALLAFALAAADWRLLRAEYHAFRLNRAQSREAAEPHLEALLDLADHAPAAESLVEKLGVERPLLTYWLLRRVLEERTLVIGLPRKSQAQRILPWLRRLAWRVEADRRFAAAWACFSHWPGWQVETDRKQFHDERRFPSLVYAGILVDSSQAERLPAKRPSHHLELEQIEAMLRFEHLHIIEKRWTWGAPVALDLIVWAGPISSISRLSAYSQVLDKADAALYEWWFSMNDLLELQFDPSSGHYMPVQPGARKMSAGTSPVPLPGWQGPVPEDEPRTGVARGR